MIATKTFRLFISSTFVDFRDERNILQNEVFPEIKDYCKSHGYNFEPIDLRWGVSKEDGLDHKAMEICIKEVKKAFNYPKPNFLAMLGNRYGWIPAPTEIESIYYFKLLEDISNEEKELFEKWYIEDLNILPNKYILQPVNNVVAEEALYEKTWAEDESKIIQIIASNLEVFPKNMLAGKSATEQEIIKGILEPAKSISTNNSKALCIERDIVNIDDMSDSQFVDKDQTQINILKENIKRTENNRVIYKRFQTKLKKREDGSYKPGSDYLDDYAMLVTNFLKEHIANELERLSRQSKSLERTIHINFKVDRTKTFIGRDAIISRTLEYIDSHLNSSPFVIYGESGVGKSALIAKIIQTIEDKYKNRIHLIYRFIGISEQSSQPKLLIDSLIEQIEQALQIDSKKTHKDYIETVDYFLELLNRCPLESKKKFIIVLDALDQFVVKTSLEWIESRLPENVKIILSTLPSEYGEYFKILKTKVKPENILEVQKLMSKDGKKILNEWLQKDNRTLQKEQMNYLLSKFEKNGLPLYLKIIFEKSLSWKSYDKDFKMLKHDTLIGAIKSSFNDLVKIQHHPEMLLKHTLGYLSASKNGLSESEIVEILSLDYIVIGDISNPHHRLPTRSNIDKVPSAIWSRLYYDLIKYLAYIEFDGLSLLNFYHRKIKECSTESYYKLDKEYYHSNLLEYFWNQPLVFIENKEVNFRKLSELPYHCIHSNSYSKFLQLNNKDFIENKIRHNQLDDLLLEYYNIASNISKSDISEVYKTTFLDTLAYNLLSYLINSEDDLLSVEILHSTYVYRKNKIIYNALLNIACNLELLMKHFKLNKKYLKPYYAAFTARKANMVRREGRLKEAERIYNHLLVNNYIEILDKVEQSRVYYDIGYIAYLSGQFDKAIENITKSADIADTNEGKVSRYISKCVEARIEFLSKDNIEKFKKVLLEAYDIFDEKRLVSLTAKRWVKNVNAHLFEVYYAKRDIINTKIYFDLLKSDDWMISHQNVGKYSSFTPYEARVKILEKDFVQASTLFEKYIYEVILDSERNTRESMARDYYDYLLSLKEVDIDKFLEQKQIALELPDEPGNHIWKEKIQRLNEEK